MLHHCTELIFITAAAITTVTAAGVVASNPTSDDLRSAVWWSVMPFVGALLSSAMAFFLSASTEDRKRAFGRCIGALLFGIAIPRFIVLFKPDLREFIQDPILLIAGGSTFGLLGYAISAKLVDYSLNRGPQILEDKLNDILDNEKDSTPRKPQS